MTYRIELSAGDREVTLAFEGDLDRTALADLAARCAAQARRGVKVRLWLRAGTRVETGVLDELAGLDGVTLAAEAPFLARWIASSSKARGGQG
jgi:hypothetical protein